MHAGVIAADTECAQSVSAELRLVAALLERAIVDAQKGSADARAWLASDVTGVGGAGWAFADVCELLSIDPAWARAQAARRDGRARRPTMRGRRLEAA